MSNVNLILSNAIAAARGDKSAQAAAVADGIFKSFAQLAGHGQKTPFQNGIAALKGWRGELATSLEAVILAQYQKALDLHSRKVKLTSDEFSAIEAGILALVNESYSQEAARIEVKKAEGKAKREQAKLDAAKAEENAKLDGASDLISALAEVGAVRAMLDKALDEREALLGQIAMLTAERDALLAQVASLTAAQAPKVARKVKQAA